MNVRRGEVVFPQFGVFTLPTTARCNRQRTLPMDPIDDIVKEFLIESYENLDRLEHFFLLFVDHIQLIYLIVFV